MYSKYPLPSISFFLNILQKRLPFVKLFLLTMSDIKFYWINLQNSYRTTSNALCKELARARTLSERASIFQSSIRFIIYVPLANIYASTTILQGLGVQTGDWSYWDMVRGWCPESNGKKGWNAVSMIVIYHPPSPDLVPGSRGPVMPKTNSAFVIISIHRGKSHREIQANR